MPKYKKLFLSSIITLLLFASTLGLFAKTTIAQQGTWYNQTYGEWTDKVLDPNNPNEIFGERYTYAQVVWIIHSLTAIVTGTNVSSCINKGDVLAIFECLEGFKDTGSLDGISGLATISGTLINARPASGINYIATTASKFHLIPEAYAQGVGFSTLSPIQTLWRAIRNISYLLMIIAFIAIAFMIMFRVRISPQAVISIQSALPRLVIAMVLIAFSYAIAGFLIDLAYLSAGVIAVAVKTGGGLVGDVSTKYLFDQLVAGNGLVSIFVGLTTFAIIIFGAGVGLTVKAGLGTAVIGEIPLVGQTLTVGLVAGIIFLIFAIFVLFVLFRIIWLLLRTITSTILLTLAGPVIILLGIFPNTGGFWGWIRALAANLAVYPVIFILTFLAHYFFWAMFLPGIADIHNNPFNTFGIVGTTYGTITLPGANLSTSILGLVAGFVTLFLIPHAANLIQSLIQRRPFDYGAAIGQATNPLGIRTFGQGVVTEAAGEFIGRQLYDRQTGGGLIGDTFRRLSTRKPQTGTGQAGGSGKGPL